MTQEINDDYVHILEKTALGEEEYLKGHVSPVLWSLQRQAHRFARIYYTLTAISIIGSAAVPIIILAFPNEKLLAAASGAIVSIVLGLNALIRGRERMLSLTVAKELGYRELLRFQTKTPPYDDPNSFQTFVRNFEKITLAEVGEWKKIHNSQIVNRSKSIR